MKRLLASILSAALLLTLVSCADTPDTPDDTTPESDEILEQLPVETPEEAPQQTPEETPVETPDTPAESPEETPVETPKQEAPKQEAPKQETPKQDKPAQNNTPAQTPAQPPAQTTPEADPPAPEAPSAGTQADTLGQTLLKDFQARANGASAQAIADGLIQNAAIQFPPATMPVEPGLLTGFGNAEITGFKEGVMFSPMMGTIPFVGYIFVLEESTNADEFVSNLKSNADPRWNICTEADETIVHRIGNTVFFLMCPNSLGE